MIKFKFDKYHGLGNDFIFISSDLLHTFFNLSDLKKFAFSICDRNFGIGADGIVFYDFSNPKKIEALIINSDGSLAGTCGNALRCLGLSLYKTGKWSGQEECPIFRLSMKRFASELKKDESFALDCENPFSCLVKLNSDESLKKTAYLTEANISVFFESPEIIQSFKEADIFEDDLIKFEHSPVFVQLANPHLVFFSPNFSSFKEKEFISFGKSVQEKYNVNINMISTDKEYSEELFSLTVFERGAGLTLACGSGAVASAHALRFLFPNLSSNISFQMPGGKIHISLPNDIQNQTMMTGPAKFIFSGEMNFNLNLI